MKYATSLDRLRSLATPSLALLSCLALTIPIQAAATVGESVQQKPSLDSEFRLETVGYRLATSNPGSCSNPEMLTGMMLQDKAAFAPEDRMAAQNAFGFKDGFYVRGVVEGSAADNAGLHAGDEIVSVGKDDMTSFASNLVKDEASVDRTEQFVAALSEDLKNGPVQVTVEHRGTERQVQLAGTLGCGGHFVVVDSNELNAWSDGRYVAVTTRMMLASATDDALAFVAAHEMAHNNRGDAKRFTKGKLFLAELGIGSGKVRKSELAADALAIQYMDRAGFDFNGAVSVLRNGPSQILPSLSHPTNGARIAALYKAHAEFALADAPKAEASVWPSDKPANNVWLPGAPLASIIVDPEFITPYNGNHRLSGCSAFLARWPTIETPDAYGSFSAPASAPIPSQLELGTFEVQFGTQPRLNAVAFTGNLDRACELGVNQRQASGGKPGIYLASM